MQKMTIKIRNIITSTLEECNGYYTLIIECEGLAEQICFSTKNEERAKSVYGGIIDAMADGSGVIILDCRGDEHFPYYVTHNKGKLQMIR